MKKKKNYNPDIDRYWLFFFSLLLFFLVLFAFRREANPEWKQVQREFQTYLAENESPESASNFTLSIKQLWIPELDRVDRCITCHLGYDQPEQTEAPQPFTAHPDISPHSMLKMGCTICHGGQGFALKKKDAHGEIKHWEEPLLGKKLGKKYGLKNESALIQIKCNICHRRDEETQGMEVINLAKRLSTKKSKCSVCHKIDGKGGKAGSDLTFIGDKPAERLDFSQIEHKLIESSKPLSIISWHFEHFMNPQEVVPGSKMKFVEFSEQEAMALSLLMMSWKDVTLPVLLIPKTIKKETPIIKTKTDKARLSQVDWGKELFENMDCSECHTIGDGVEAGPDLKGVTKKRDAQWLRKMIRDPENMEDTDPLAKQLFLEYDELGMPTNEDLTKGGIEAIISYIESFK